MVEQQGKNVVISQSLAAHILECVERPRIRGGRIEVAAALRRAIAVAEHAVDAKGES